ncbi:hypothetical protein HF992_00825 [Streptococcus ovuberis]|uniref:Uncharacterized protein n=1 Tax=Streptococcus ovuberis TaxID=1936207 RepID=A0A7X6MX70_9STRE|nr:hypothetical protein [Streptococcus ovuberis]
MKLILKSMSVKNLLFVVSFMVHLIPKKLLKTQKNFGITTIALQNAPTWLRDSSQGLLDRRGKGLNSKPNLTPEEALQLKIKQLEERNRYLEMEVGLLAVACCQSCRHLVPNAWTSLAGLSVTRFASNG